MPFSSSSKSSPPSLSKAASMFQNKRKLFLNKEKTRKLLKRIDEDLEAWTDLAIETFKFSASAQERWKNGTIQDKKTILTVVGTNLTLKEKRLEIKPRTPFLLIKKAIGANKFKKRGLNPEIEPKSRQENFHTFALGE